MTHHRGSVYLLVLGAAMIVSIIGLSAIWLVRVQRTASQMDQDYGESQLCARSAVEAGLHRIGTDPNWRTSGTGGTWLSNEPFGNGNCSLVVTDPADGDLADDPWDSVVLTGTGVKGAARHKTQVTLTAVYDPLEALRTCLHASGQVQVNAGKTITLIGGPISTNANLHVDGTVDGDAEAATRSGSGPIKGTATIPAPAKQMPEASVFDAYKGLAVTIPYPGATLQKVVLSPGSNPWGVTSPDGIYFMDTAGKDLTIKGVRIHGTLIIQANGRKVTVDDAAFFRNFRSDYPVLVVSGNVEILLRSREYMLSEATWASNFNPPGTPYQGVTDTDAQDQYPNEIQGLVHVKGTLLFKNSARVRGVVICEGTVTCDDGAGIVWDQSLYANPPIGYRLYRMRISPGSWQQVVD
jgi:hypothetical protein